DFHLHTEFSIFAIDTSTADPYTLSLHDALPISRREDRARHGARRRPLQRPDRRQERGRPRGPRPAAVRRAVRGRDRSRAPGDRSSRGPRHRRGHARRRARPGEPRQGSAARGRLMRLQRLDLTGFMGVGDYSLTLDGKNASILGKNAAGKSTLLSAYTWL